MVDGKDQLTSPTSSIASVAVAGVPPGKRGRTDGLPAHGGPASTGAVALAADDPFGLHLLSAVVGRGDELERLAVMERSIAESVNRVRRARDGLESTRSEAEVIATMLRAATAIVAAMADRDDLDRATHHVRRIGEHLEELWVLGRRDNVDQAAAGLDLVFVAEDALAVKVGLAAPQRRKRYYADRVAEDLVGAARPDGVSLDPRTGGELIQAFVDWFELELRQHASALESIRDIVDEPVPAKPPSMVETLIATAAQTLVGMLPGQLLGAVTDAFVAWAKTSRSGQAPLEGPRVKDPRVGYIEQDVIASVGAFLKPTVDDVLAMGPAKIAPEPAGAAVGGPIALAFTERMTAEIDAYQRAATGQLGELRSGLALVPPAGLQVLVAAMKEGTAGRIATLKVDALVKWTAFVAEVTGGRDERGNHAHEGPLATVVDMPGAVQIAIAVRRGHTGLPRIGVPRVLHGMPDVEVRRVWMNGIGDETKKKLREAARPLRAVEMHRALIVSIEDAETGVEMPIGRIDVGPAGQIDVDDVRWTELAMLAGGETPDERPPEGTERVLRQADGASKARAQAGAQILLSYVSATTRQIE